MALDAFLSNCTPPSHPDEHSPSRLMRSTYQALRTRAKNMLIQELTTNDPPPPYYQYPLSPSPHPFMGLGKYLARRIHQMRSAKSYLAAHPSWFDENPDPTCPQCGEGPDSFQHAILTCPARTRVRDLLLKDVSSLEHDATILSQPRLIRGLGEYITDTKTGFRRDRLHDRYSSPFTPPTQD